MNPKILTQITFVKTALKEQHFHDIGHEHNLIEGGGIGDSLVIEYHDPATGHDYLIEVIAPREIRQQSRKSLFAPMEITSGGQRVYTERRISEGDASNLKKRLDGADRKIQEQAAEITKLRTELDNQQSQIKALADRIHSVEVYSFNQYGVIDNHLVLDQSDADEEIPISNVVVKLRREVAA